MLKKLVDRFSGARMKESSKIGVLERKISAPIKNGRANFIQERLHQIEDIQSCQLDSFENETQKRNAILDIAISDTRRSQKMDRIFENSLSNFHQQGENYTRQVQSAEILKIGEVNADVALGVARGAISREVALILVEKFGHVLNKKQIVKIAALYVARQDGEEIKIFNKRRAVAKERMAKISGINPQKIQEIKQDIEDILYLYWKAEQKATAGDSWPHRADGDARRSFINRQEVLSQCVETLDFAKKAMHDPDGAKREIQEFKKIPERIHDMNDMVDIVDAHDDIKAVTFDMFDTLVEWTSSGKERKKIMYQNATKLLQSYGILIDENEFRSIRTQIWDQKYKKTYYPRRDFKAADALSEIFEIICIKKSKHFDKDTKREIVEKLEEVFIGVDSDTAIPTPEIVQVLEKLRKRNVKIAVVSNHPYKLSSVERLLRKFGLRKYIDEVIVSSEVGYRKTPRDSEGKIFHHALQKLGLPPNAVIHVGDSVVEDYQGAQSVGINSTVFDNPTSAQKDIQLSKLDPSSAEYKERCLMRYKNHLDLGADSYFTSHKGEFTPEHLRLYARRLYEITRDVYAPLLIKFSEQALKELQINNNSLNLCTGRDALGMFLVQRKLVKMFPEEYGRIDPMRIRHVPVSRKTVNQSDPALLRRYLGQFGFEDFSHVNIIDNGIVGSTQSRLQDLYKDKQFQGLYLQHMRYRNDSYGHKKRGFIFELDAEREYDPQGRVTNVRTHGMNIPTGISYSDIGRTIATSDFVHVQEDLWNGLFTSPQTLREDGNRVRPHNYIGGREKVDFTPGDPDIISGLNAKTYALMKKMALKGLVDGLKLYRRQRQLGINYNDRQAIQGVVKWFDKHNKLDSLDHQLMNGMARKR